MPRTPPQQPLPFPSTWGGCRPGAGRKLTPGRRPSVTHQPRPTHITAHPVHVTLRTIAAVRCLRSDRVFKAVQRALGAASHSGFRVFEFSVQDDHIHLLVEADDGPLLSAGMRGLAIRVARAVNRSVGHRGPVWGDRYHARPLSNPRAVRHALVYVLMNARKHGVGRGGVDTCSSAPWFDAWKAAPLTVPTEPPPVRRPRTWLATVGWRRHGLIDVDEQPAARCHPRR